MNDVGAMVAELIAAGCAPEVAAKVVAQAVVFGVLSAPRPQISADVSADRRREKDRIRKQNAREIPQNSADVCGLPQMSENASLYKKEKKEEERKEERAVSETRPRTNRGHRLPEDWQPSPSDFADAIELVGSDRARSELAKFRDHWKQQPGQRGVKLDWDAAWRNWIRRTADFRPPRQGPNGHLTQHQLERQQSREILDDLGKFIDAGSGGGDQADFGLLRFDPGDEQARIHDGVGRVAIDVPASRLAKGG